MLKYVGSFEELEKRGFNTCYDGWFINNDYSSITIEKDNKIRSYIQEDDTELLDTLFDIIKDGLVKKVVE